jgi:hypothetical protein
VVWNGQPAPVAGWFVDGHGHRVFLREGDLAPICPHFGPAPVAWRLLYAVGG